MSGTRGLAASGVIRLATVSLRGRGSAGARPSGGGVKGGAATDVRSGGEGAGPGGTSAAQPTVPPVHDTVDGSRIEA